VPINSLRDTPGPMAQSVADLVLLDGAVTGDTVITKVYIRYYPLQSRLYPLISVITKVISVNIF
jgi:hypothetical protein